MIAVVAFGLTVVAQAASTQTSQGRSSTPAPPMPSLDAVVRGQVLDPTTGTPIAGALVSCLPNSLATPKTEVTDARGRFSFANVGLTGRVHVTASGYVAAADGSNTRQFIASSAAAQDITLTLVRTGRIQGIVWNTNGVVAPGVLVRAYRYALANPHRVFSATTPVVSNMRGEYVIDNLAPGQYTVAALVVTRSISEATLEAYQAAAATPRQSTSAALLKMFEDSIAPPLGPAEPPTGGPGAPEDLRSSRTTFLPSAPTSADARIVTVEAGGSADRADISLLAARTVAVTGTLRGPSGPAAYTAVRLIAASPEAIGRELDDATAVAVTDATGTFSFHNVPPGAYLVRTIVAAPARPSRVETTTEAALLNAIRPIQWWAESAIAVGDENLSLPALMLRRPLVVTGRVTASGQSVKGMHLLLLRPQPFAYGVVEGMVDGDGRYRIEVGLPGVFDLATRYVSSDRGNDRLYVKSATIAGRDVTDTQFELQDDSALDIVMAPAAAMVTIRMRPPARAASADGQVIVFPADYRAWIAKGMPRRLMRTRVLSPPFTAYPVGNLAPGDYLMAVFVPSSRALLAVAPEFPVSLWPDARLIEMLAPLATRVTVSGKGITQELPLIQ